VKTSLVIKTWGGQFRRGSIPSDGTDFKMVPWFWLRQREAAKQATPATPARAGVV
jgi:hypothetical protein